MCIAYSHVLVAHAYRLSPNVSGCLALFCSYQLNWLNSCRVCAMI